MVLDEWHAMQLRVTRTLEYMGYILELWFELPLDARDFIEAIPSSENDLCKRIRDGLARWVEETWREKNEEPEQLEKAEKAEKNEKARECREREARDRKRTRSPSRTSSPTRSPRRTRMRCSSESGSSSSAI